MSGIIFFKGGPGELQRSFDIGEEVVDKRLRTRHNQDQVNLVDLSGAKTYPNIGPVIIFRDDGNMILRLHPEIESKIFPADEIKLDPHHLDFIRVDSILVYFEHLLENGFPRMVEKYRRAYGLER